MEKKDPKAVMLTSAARHAKRAADNTIARDRAIFGAHHEGASLREIAAAVNLSHTAVDKIIKRETAARADAG